MSVFVRSARGNTHSLEFFLEVVRGFFRFSIVHVGFVGTTEEFMPVAFHFAALGKQIAIFWMYVEKCWEL